MDFLKNLVSKVKSVDPFKESIKQCVIIARLIQDKKEINVNRFEYFKSVLNTENINGKSYYKILEKIDFNNNLIAHGTKEDSPIYELAWVICFYLKNTGNFQELTLEKFLNDINALQPNHLVSERPPGYILTNES